MLLFYKNVIVLTCCFFLVLVADAQPGARIPVPKKASYIVTEVFDTVLYLFKKGDKLTISPEEGLKHYRKGKLVNRHKLEGQIRKQRYTAPCQVPPCPEFEKEVFVYRAEHWDRYVSVADLSSSWLRMSRLKITDSIPAVFGEASWEPWYRLREIK